MKDASRIEGVHVRKGGIPDMDSMELLYLDENQTAPSLPEGGNE